MEFEGERVSEAIRRTFERRKTPLPASVPTALTPDFYEEKSKQTQWRAFFTKGNLLSKEKTLADTALVLREFLMPPTEAVVSGRTFDKRWSQGGKWKNKI